MKLKDIKTHMENTTVIVDTDLPEIDKSISENAIVDYQCQGLFFESNNDVIFVPFSRIRKLVFKDNPPETKTI